MNRVNLELDRSYYLAGGKLLILDILFAYMQEFFLLVNEASVIDGDLLTWVSA